MSKYKELIKLLMKIMVALVIIIQMLLEIVPILMA